MPDLPKSSKSSKSRRIAVDLEVVRRYTTTVIVEANPYAPMEAINAARAEAEQRFPKDHPDWVGTGAGVRNLTWDPDA
jgi:hypothetical protein